MPEGSGIEDLSDSLYLYYRKALGIWIVRAEDRVGVGEVPAWAPPEFGPAAGCGRRVHRADRLDPGWRQRGILADLV